MLGRFDEAWPAAREASARWREVSSVDGSHLLADLARYEGDDEAAEAYLARFCDWAEAHGQRSYLSTYAPTRGRLLWALGRYDEAEALAQLGQVPTALAVQPAAVPPGASERRDSAYL